MAAPAALTNEVSNAPSTAGTSITLTLDSGTVDKLAVLLIAGDHTSDSLTVDTSGWTLIGVDTQTPSGGVAHTTAWAYKANTSDTSVAFSWTTSDLVIAIGAHSPDTDFGTTAPTVTGQGSAATDPTPHPSASWTPTTDDVRAVSVAFIKDTRRTLVSFPDADDNIEDLTGSNSGNHYSGHLCSAGVTATSPYSAGDWDWTGNIRPVFTTLILYEDAGGTAYDETSTEAAGVTDSTDAVKTVEATKAEAVGVIDNTSRVYDAERVSTEAQGVTDSIDAVKATEVVVTEAVGVTDDVSRVVPYERTTTEVAGVADNVDPVKSVTPTVTDPAGVTDDVSYVLTPPGVTRLTRLSTQIAQKGEVGVRLTRESVQVAQKGKVGARLTRASVQIAQIYLDPLTPAIADPVGITDSIVTSKDVKAAITDDVGATDATSYQLFNQQSVTDAVGVTDSASTAKDIKQTIADPVGVTDTTVSVLPGRETSQESIGVTDSTLLALDAVRTSTEAVGVTDSVSILLTRTQEIVESVGVTDSTSRDVTYERELVEAAGVTDAVTEVLGTPYVELSGTGHASGEGSGVMALIVGVEMEIVHDSTLSVTVTKEESVPIYATGGAGGPTTGNRSRRLPKSRFIKVK